MRSAARGVEEKFMGESKEKGRMVLWTNSATKENVMRKIIGNKEYSPIGRERR